MTEREAGQIDAAGAARLFLIARGRGGANAAEDLGALTELLRRFGESAYREGLTDARAAAAGAEAEHRRMVSLGQSEVTHDYYTRLALGARNAVQAIDRLLAAGEGRGHE